MKRDENSGDHGSAFVWVLALCAICVVVSLSAAKLGAAAGAVAHAQNAADAAALSGAYEIAHSKSTHACSSARIAAKKNQAIVESCNFTNDEIVIEVYLESYPKAKAKARAEIG